MTISESAPKENGKLYNNIDSFLSVKTELPLFDEKKCLSQIWPTFGFSCYKYAVGAYVLIKESLLI
jgi:hypothetical protein